MTHATKSDDHKLSLFAAIFININIMLGAGFFINTVILTKEAGSLGPFVYLLVATVLLPLIASIAKLLQHTPSSGTFYDFGKHISPYFGFLSGWSYFVAKMCSTGLGIHVCLSFLQKIIPFLQQFDILTIDVAAIALFTSLNMLNLRIGKHIQLSFICLKIIPVLFVIITGTYLFSGAHFTPNSLLWSGIPLSVPMVLYVFTGFEASCSLSSKIRDAEVNGPRAIYISYAIAVSIVFLYQLLFYGSLGMYLGTLAGGYLDMFPALLAQLRNAGVAISDNSLALFHIAIASSSLGSAYGIMYSNSWNLYTLAYNNHTFGKKMLTTKNDHGMPYACIVAEGLLAIAFVLITQGRQVPLQQVGSLGSVIAYTFSVIALFVVSHRKRMALHLPLLGLMSCGLLLASYVWAVMTHGATPMLMVFLALLFLGSLMFYAKHQAEESLAHFEKL